MRMNISGRWPDEVTIRSNWSKAKGRSWNRDLPYGYVRVIRGNAAFTRAAAEHVLGYDVELVASPPLLKGPDKPWEKAGFQPFLELHLYRRSLVGDLPDRQPEVTTVASPDFTTFYAIDRSAFNPLWRMEPLGLEESYRATTRSVVLTTSNGDRVVGYAIVGLSGITAYLQRIAVDPAMQRQGHGQRLLKAAVRWAGDHGAATMLLNTQPENDVSANLYRAQGFARVPGGLRVMKYEG